MLFLLLLFLILPSASGKAETLAISADGSLSHLRWASSESTNSAFCIKYRSAQALISIQNSTVNDDAVFYKTYDKDKIALFVGTRHEALEGRRRSMEWAQNYERELGQSISVEGLGLGIANLAHEQSMYPSTQQLLYNTIVMGSHRKEYINNQNSQNSENNQTNDSNSTTSEVVYVPCILRVDVSGNFYRCDATAIGSKASIIRNWLETKGTELILNERNQTSTIDTENNDILTVMGLAYHCIIDNYKEVTHDSTNTNDHIDIQISFNGFDYNENQIIGPVTLSNQIFNTNTTCMTTDKNETQGSIRQQGLRIWTFLKQSKLVSLVDKIIG